MIATLLALKEIGADGGLKLGHPSHHRRLIDAENIRRAQRRTSARDREYETEIRPIDHAPFCKNAEWLGNNADCCRQRPNVSEGHWLLAEVSQ